MKFSIGTKLVNAAKEQNLLFSAVTVFVGAMFFLTANNNKLILALLLSLLFHYLIMFLTFSRVKEQIDKTNVSEISIELSLLKIKPILILVLAGLISTLHVLTENVVIKAALMFIASFLLTESWISMLKKQILNELKKYK